MINIKQRIVGWDCARGFKTRTIKKITQLGRHVIIIRTELYICIPNNLTKKQKKLVVKEVQVYINILYTKQSNKKNKKTGSEGSRRTFSLCVYIFYSVSFS